MRILSPEASRLASRSSHSRILAELIILRNLSGTCGPDYLQLGRGYTEFHLPTIG